MKEKDTDIDELVLTVGIMAAILRAGDRIADVIAAHGGPGALVTPIAGAVEEAWDILDAVKEDDIRDQIAELVDEHPT